VSIKLKKTTYYLLISLAFISCRDYASVDISKNGIENTFDGLMQEAIDNSYDQMYGVSASVSNRDKNIDWQGAIGYDGKSKRDSLGVEQPFRIASITKTFVATAILRLHEMDSISIHDPISKYISEEHQSLLKKGNYDVDKITLLHCLNHTSGLYDYAMGGSPYIKVVMESPEKRWTRTEQLEFAIEYGKKVGFPGEKYYYSDTGYVLLGEIIEQFYHGDLALGLRDLIGYEKLGMDYTWLESLEDEPDGIKSLVKRYLGRTDASKYDASIDLYGGGGLVSTTGDLAKFTNALFNKKIFKEQKTLELMLQKHDYDPSYDTSEDKRYKDYRQGFWVVNVLGNKTYMHSGLWGTHIMHQPHNNTSIAVNFTKGKSDRLLKKILMAVDGYKPK